MKYIIIFILTIFSVDAVAQTVPCDPNMDFEYGNFSYWYFFQGTCCVPFTVNTSVTPPSAATSGRETITSGTGTDPYGGFPTVDISGAHSLKLGTDDNNRKADRARYFLHVPSGVTNYALMYRYAIVMEDPGHVASKQPRFQVSTIDSATGDTVSCGNFLYVAGSLPGFSLSSAGTNVYYKPWSTASINLSGYNGHTIIVDFIRGDCDLNAHFGYGYVDMTCGFFAITVNACLYNTTTTLSAPPGFEVYTWMDSAMTTVIDTGQIVSITTPSVNTVYKLIITPYSGYGCPDTLTTHVIVSNLNLHPRDTALCIGKTLTLDAHVTGGLGPKTYTWGPAPGLSCLSCLNPVVTPLTTKKYYLTVADSSGCSRTDTIRVRVNNLPNIRANADTTICAQDSTAMHVTGGVSYLWSPLTGLSCGTCANLKTSPALTTTYIVTGTDSSGCINTDTVVIRVNPLPAVSAGPDKTICRNDSVNIQATGAKDYTWSPITGLSCSHCTISKASPTVTTTYVVTGTDTNNCVKRDTVIVKVNQLPAVNAGADKTFCFGDSASLSASGAATYTWTPSTGLSCANCSNPVAKPTVTTTYIVTGTDTNNCVKTDTVTMHVNALPNIRASADTTICIKDSAAIHVTGGTTYVWSPITGLSCGTCANLKSSPSGTTSYIVTGTDSNGCSNRDTVAVRINPLPAVNAGPDKTICRNDSVNVSATGAADYTWSPSTGLSCSNCANTKASPTVTTTYVVTGTDTNRCVKKDTVVVKVNPLPTVNAGADKTFCFGDSASLSASGASTYTWTPSTGLSCANCSNPVAKPTVTTTYIVTGTDTNNCAKKDTVIVHVNTLPTVSAGPDQSICFKSSSSLSATGALKYKWTPSAGLACDSCATTSFYITTAATYVVTGTDANGCKDADTTAITILPRPTVVAGSDTGICLGATATIGATGASSYVWYPTTGLACSTCPSTKVTPTVTTTYTVAGTAANGCSDTQKVLVTVHQLPQITVTHDTDICDGASIQLHVNGAKNYIWSPTTGLSCVNCPDPVSSPTDNITYSVIGTDVYGCVDSDKVTLNLIKKLPITISKDDTICKGQSVQLQATGGTIYQWTSSNYLNNDHIANPVSTPPASIQYKVVIKQSYCFVDSGYIKITVVPTPAVQLGNDTTILVGNSVQLNATVLDAISYAWSPPEGLSCIYCPDPIATPKKTTTYSVYVRGLAGCNATDEVTIHVICEGSQLYVPNTFTPNSDGINDKFYPSGKGIAEITRFSVYDRWGELLYEQNHFSVNDMNYGWDGSYKGKKLDPDVFVYIITATCESGETLHLKGDVSIIK